jgi:hypothetical protein
VTPLATATIAPMGRRAKTPRDYSIEVAVKIGAETTKYGDKAVVEQLVRKSLAGFPPEEGKPDQRRFGDGSLSSKGRKAWSTVQVVVGVAVSSGRPEEHSIRQLRQAFREGGYRVVVSEKRECADATCEAEALIDWSRPLDVPQGWYSNEVCGKHNYRSCSSCKSVYLLTSTNSPGPAASVHCEVCGLVLVEWGSSKLWEAELVTRVEAL